MTEIVILTAGYSLGTKGWVVSASPVMMRKMHMLLLRPNIGLSKVKMT